MDETALVQQAQRGDEHAFEQLVVAHQKRVYNYCLRMTGNPEDALDLSQEAFLRAYRALNSFKRESSFSTWLYRLTANCCIDFLRRERRRKVVSLSQMDRDGEQVLLEIPDPDEGPEASAERSELRTAISRALRRLSSDHRGILILREMNGLSYGEIALVLGISEGTVKSRISRARTELCKYLNIYGNFSAAVSSDIPRGGEPHEL